MSQNTLIMPTTGTWSGLQIMNQINPALDSLASCFAGSTKPTVGGTGGAFQTGQWWLDTTNGSQPMICMSLGGVDQRLLPLLDAQFQARAQSTPNMTVNVSAGNIFNGTTFTAVAAQTTSAFTAPVGNPRIDRIVLNPSTGAYTVVTGTPAASPSPPAIPAGKCPVAQISLAVGQSSITNASIYNEFYNNDSIYGGGTIAGALTLQSTLAVTGAITPNQTAGIIGTTTNNSPNAGCIGEIISSFILFGSPVNVAVNTPTTLTSITLTPGDWDMDGQAGWITPNAAQLSLTYLSFSNTTNVIQLNQFGFSGILHSIFTGDGSSVASHPLVTTPIKIATTTTYYLVVQHNCASTTPFYGGLKARRVR